MKLPPVDYEAPKTVSEAVELLAEHLDEASVLAGGQSLIPLLALRLAHPAVLIDINGIDGHRRSSRSPEARLSRRWAHAPGASGTRICDHQAHPSAGDRLTRVTSRGLPPSWLPGQAE